LMSSRRISSVMVHLCSLYTFTRSRTLQICFSVRFSGKFAMIRPASAPAGK
jgi:hypothetical protein